MLFYAAKIFLLEPQNPWGMSWMDDGSCNLLNITAGPRSPMARNCLSAWHQLEKFSSLVVHQL